LHGTDKDDPALRRRLTALYFADRRQEARKLFDSLDEQIKTLPQYAEIGAAIYERAGLLAECRAILERSLLHQEDLQRRLQWLSLSERLSQPDVVFDWLNKVPPDQQGRPRDLMMLALTMDRYLGDPTKCLPIAYRALRAAFVDPQIHLGYISIFLRGRIGRGQIDTPTEVARDTAVVLAEKGSERRLTRILETEPNPRVDRDEVSPDYPLASRLIGLRVGDEVETKALGIDSITYVVTTIQNKYVHAHFRSLERFEAMFPESRAFGSFKIDPTKGEESFKPIFDAVKRRGEFARQIEDMYRSGQLPLAIGAKLGGSDGLEFWESIHSHPGLQFNVAVGNREDYEVARQILQGNRRAVIDPITLWGLVRLRIADIVRSSFDDLGIVQTALDLLRRTVQERRDNRGVEQSRLAWDGEHYRMTKLGPEAIEYRISEAEAVLAFAEALTLVPAEAAVEVPDEARKLYEDLDPAYFDTILAARGDNRVLLSDDRQFRALATEAIGIAGIWSQAAVMSGSVLRIVTADNYCKVAVTLAETGYFYTSVNCGTFVYALRQSSWALTPTVNALIDWLVRPQNEPLGVLGVLSELIRVGWALKPDDRQFEDFFAALFAGFNRADPKRDLAGLVQMAFSNLDGVIHRQFLRTRFAEELCNSTYLTPVAVSIAEIDGLRHRLGSRIGLSLSNALRTAVSRNSEASPVSV